MRLVGYVRVSTAGQEASGLGVGAQRSAITGAAAQRGAELVEIFSDSASGRSMGRRPGLAACLAALEAGEADGLIVAKLDRLSRSLLDFAALMERSRAQGWSLIGLDLGVDTSTPSGELMAHTLAAFAQFERRLIGQRTREALDELRASGVRLGRPPSIDDATIARMVELRQAGLTYKAVCEALNEAGVPTSRGGQWRPATVQQSLKSRGLGG